MGFNSGFKGLNAELNPICQFQALLGAHHIHHISRIRVNVTLYVNCPSVFCLDNFSPKRFQNTQ